MVLSFTPEQEARLVKIAEQGGQSLEDRVAETALHLIEVDAFDDAIVEERRRQADAGVFIEQAEVSRRFEQMMGIQ